MELNEVITELRLKTKPYLHVDMKQSTYFNTLRNIEAGLAKQSTIAEFMAKFGYIAKTETYFEKR